MEVIEGFYNEFNNIFEKIEDSKGELKQRDGEYRKMREEYYKIMDKYPNLQLMFEDDVQFQLNKDECNALCNVVRLHANMSSKEEKEIYFLGAKDAYYYFRNMRVIE